MRVLMSIATLGLATMLVACSAPSETREFSVPNSAPVQAAVPTGGIMSILNQERAARGLPALREDARLSRASRLHAQDMVANDYFAHVGLNGSTLSTRARAAGYTCVAAENIAIGQKTNAAVMTAWMNSPPHRRNIMLSDTAEFGIGRVGDMWVMMFGRGC